MGQLTLLPDISSLSLKLSEKCSFSFPAKIISLLKDSLKMNNINVDKDTIGSDASVYAAQVEAEVIDLVNEVGDKGMKW